METGIRGKTYKIGQAAKLLDVKPFVLRFWESEFRDVLVPIRTPSGQRAYSEQNVDTVREIKRLLYDEGLTIEGAKRRLGQLHGNVVRAQIASPAPASPEQSSIAYTSVAAARAVAAASAPEPEDATTRSEPRSEPQAEALRATLRSIKSELLSIRDLLGG
jgi:DNA-binding transcriptional MerR regulator